MVVVSEDFSGGGGGQWCFPWVVRAQGWTKGRAAQPHSLASLGPQARCRAGLSAPPPGGGGVLCYTGQAQMSLVLCWGPGLEGCQTLGGPEGAEPMLRTPAALRPPSW